MLRPTSAREDADLESSRPPRSRPRSICRRFGKSRRFRVGIGMTGVALICVFTVTMYCFFSLSQHIRADVSIVGMRPAHIPAAVDSRPARCRAAPGSPAPANATIVVALADDEYIESTVESIVRETDLLEEVLVVLGPNQKIDVSTLGPTVKTIQTQLESKVARLKLGADGASSESIVFVGMPIATSFGWLDALLRRLDEEPKTVVTSVVDSKATANIDWSLRIVPKEEMDDSNYIPTSAIQSPVFAVTKDFFLSALASGMHTDLGAPVDIIELAIRAWSCGGQVEVATCSLARSLGTWDRAPASSLLDQMHIAVTWMDEWALLTYELLGAPDVDVLRTLSGDAYRWRMSHPMCAKSKFANYAPHVHPKGSVVTAPHRDITHFGQIQNELGMCLEMGVEGAVQTGPCWVGSRNNTQTFALLGSSGAVVNFGTLGSCLGLDDSGGVAFVPCDTKQQARWELTESKQLRAVAQGLCLSTLEVLELDTCKVEDPFQTWTWNAYSPPSPFIRMVDELRSPEELVGVS